MNLDSLLTAAKAGELAACDLCPSSPRRSSDAVFGTSCECRSHGGDWLLSGANAISMTVLRDPANTTPSQTGRLCFVCNSVNSTDRTAQNAFALWRAGVSLVDDGEQSTRYLDRHYFTNAALHGTDTTRLKRARQCCATLLGDQIRLLNPKVIIACGADAAASLYDLGYLSGSWAETRGKWDVANGAYREDLATGGRVYCTYHTSAGVVNRTVSRLYTPETERLIEKKRALVSDQRAIDSFLERHSKYETAGKGMRVLLLHWLDIGMGVRGAHGLA